MNHLYKEYINRNKSYIDKIKEIVEEFKDPEEAYNKVQEQFEEWNYEYDEQIEMEVINVINSYLKKGNHPLECIDQIYEHPLFS